MTDLKEGEKTRTEAEFQDLKNDLAFVVDLNKQIADKYDSLISSFPTSEEIEDLIILLIHKKINDSDYKERLFQLKRFKSAIVMLEKNSLSMKPPRYDDLKNKGETNEENNNP
jgi:GTP-sensing pleiotropic transcriptional regulator CodY